MEEHRKPQLSKLVTYLCLTVSRDGLSMRGDNVIRATTINESQYIVKTLTLRLGLSIASNASDVRNVTK